MSEEKKIFPTFDAYKEGNLYFDEYKDSYRCVWDAATAAAETKYKLTPPEVTKENVSGLVAAVVAFNPEVILTAARILERRLESFKNNLEVVPHTYSGFKSIHFMKYQQRPQEQDIFDAGMRAGREVSWLARHYEAIAMKNFDLFDRSKLQFTEAEKKDIANGEPDFSMMDKFIEQQAAKRKVPMKAIADVMMSLFLNDDLEYANKILAAYDADYCPTCKFIKHHCRCPDKKS